MKTISLTDLQESGENIARLPFSIRILLENALRNKDGFSVTDKHVDTLLHWKAEGTDAEVPFKPARDRKSTRLNSSHVATSYAVFCLKKKFISTLCSLKLYRYPIHLLPFLMCITTITISTMPSCPTTINASRL